jgi:hypothetical protein
MRFPTPARTAARSWWPTLLALAVGAAGFVTAQAPVARTEISTDLLMSLLGSGKAIEIELPHDVRFVHVVATQGDAVIVDRSTEVGERTEGRVTSIVVSVGAVGATLRCPLTVFIQVDRLRDGQPFGGGMTSACLEVDAPVALWPAPRPGLHAPLFDVGTWYAIDGFWPAEVGPGAPPPSEDDVVEFHVYLATDDAAPPVEELGITDR